MFSDSEVDIDKKFAIQDNLVEKLKGDIFTPKTDTMQSVMKKIKKFKYNEENIEDEIDNVFFYENFLVNLNHSKSKAETVEIKTYNSQKNVVSKKGKMSHKLNPPKEKILIVNNNKNTVKTRHNNVTFSNYSPPVTNINNHAITNIRPREKISSIKISEGTPSKKEERKEKLKVSRQKSNNSLSFVPTKPSDKNNPNIQSLDKCHSINKSKSHLSGISEQKEKDNSKILPNNNNINMNPTHNNNSNNALSSNNSEITKKGEYIIQKKKNRFSFFCCLPIN